MEHSYFQWLIERIAGGEMHSLLLYTLHSMDYYYDASIPIDGARGADGLSLREKYIAETGDSDILYDYNMLDERPCTVLEWLLGMAIRCEHDVMYNEDEGDRTSFWFWCMIENMGFEDYDNIRWNDHISVVVRQVIDDILNRNFDSDGAGGPFPVANSCEDMRDIDWWRALNMWLSDNFFDEFSLDI